MNFKGHMEKLEVKKRKIVRIIMEPKFQDGKVMYIKNVIYVMPGYC